jgi:hypothetical protein
MQESLLHYIWQFQYLDRSDLQTASGEKIIVFHPGFRNTHAGPDFSNARIMIGDLEWIGSVEIHIYASGWNDHKHDTDPAYENVVLHVVWKNDAAIIRKDQSQLPTFELQGRVEEKLLLSYNDLLLNPETIPCSASINKVHELTRLSMLEKALMTRLENKAGTITKIQHSNKSDWEQTCYQLLCRNFGFKVNADPFQALAESLPYKIIMKHADKLLQIEALLFGQAGFLEEHVEDEYFMLLKREHNLLGRKFNLQDQRLKKSQWKFLRLRPANFPTIRIAQLAGLLYANRNLFSKFIEAKSYPELVNIFSVGQSEYWSHHYLFNKIIESEIPALGKMSIDNIIVNTVVPLMVSYGKATDEQGLVDQAVRILQDVNGEENAIVRKWNALGMKAKSAFDSQALLELHNNYCLRRRCLDCAIGSSLIRPGIL